MSKSITVSESIEIINKEIEWCNNNPATMYGLPEEYGKGFVKGLEQAIYLLRAFQNSINGRSTRTFPKRYAKYE